MLCVKCYSRETDEGWPIEERAEFIFQGQTFCREHMDKIIKQFKELTNGTNG